MVGFAVKLGSAVTPGGNANGTFVGLRVYDGILDGRQDGRLALGRKVGSLVGVDGLAVQLGSLVYEGSLDGLRVKSGDFDGNLV